MTGRIIEHEVTGPFIRLHGKNPDGSCRCGKEHKGGKGAGKHPVNHGWTRVLETETPQEGEWLGLRTGESSGVFVIDLDMPDGPKNFAAVCAPYGGVPDTFVRQTPSGGLHFLFKAPEGGGPTVSARLGKGVDFRGTGGQIAYHAPGYKTVRSVPLLPVPEWLLPLLDAPEAKGPSAPAVDRPKPVEPPLSDLTPIVQRLALVWPEDGARHDVRLALTGALLWWGWSTEDTGDFLHALYREIGDPENENISPSISSTDRRIRAGEKVSGWGVLAKALGSEFVKDIRTELGMVDPEVPTPGWLASQQVKKQTNPDRARHPKATPGHQYTANRGEPSTKAFKMTPANVLHALTTDDEWAGRIWFDTRASVIRVFDPPFQMDAETGSLSDADVTNLQAWFECRRHGLAPLSVLEGAIMSVAQMQRFDPVREYLAELPESKHGAIRELGDLLGLGEGVEREMFRAFWIGAVARAYEPGVAFDHTLILMGPPSFRKSTMIRVLFGEWNREGLPSLDSKDAQVALRKCWGIEIPELSSWLRTDKNTKKDFISRRVDTYRPPYGKQDVDFPRAVVFIGTTNDDEILDDETGNRRYWPCKVTRTVDIDRVREIRDAVWAEARDAYLGGEPFNTGDVVGGDSYRQQFNRTDPWDGAIEGYVNGRDEITGRLSEVYKEAIGLGDPECIARLTRRETDRVAAILRRMGFSRASGTYKWTRTVGRDNPRPGR